MSWPKGRPHPHESYRGHRQPWGPDRWLEAFRAKTVVEPSGCWTWIGARAGGAGRGGSLYGYVHKDGRMQPAHRAYWEATNGPVPEGLDLDHLCRNRLCVNLDHLEPVTRLENILRGDLGARWLRVRAARGGRA